MNLRLCLLTLTWRVLCLPPGRYDFSTPAATHRFAMLESHRRLRDLELKTLAINEGEHKLRKDVMKLSDAQAEKIIPTLKTWAIAERSCDHPERL